MTRAERGRLLAVLSRQIGSADRADDAVQEALVQAATQWRRDGVPANPVGWLTAVARRRAVDSARRAASQRSRAGHAVVLAPTTDESSDMFPDDADHEFIVDDAGVRDEQLRLLILCCHPALDRETQIALTLRLAGGLTTLEIARAFLIPEATLAQRIVRAKRKIRDARIPLTIPADLDTRLGALLTTLYLVFNEAYLTRGDRAASIAEDLADEAIRLTRLVIEVAPASAEADALLALQLFARSRFATRTTPVGDLVLLDNQDRSRWDGAMIAEANGVLFTAMRRMEPGRFQLEALIASMHANARTAVDTDWPKIVSLYTQLMAVAPSPVVALNRAVAVAMADGPSVGLSALQRVEGLDDYHLFHAAHGEMLARLDRREDACIAFERALALATSQLERDHLTRRLESVRG